MLDYAHKFVIPSPVANDSLSLAVVDDSPVNWTCESGVDCKSTAAGCDCESDDVDCGAVCICDSIAAPVVDRPANNSSQAAIEVQQKERLNNCQFLQIQKKTKN